MRFPTKYTHYGYGWLDKIKQGYHPGIDYNNGPSYSDEGQDVIAICDGTVTYARYNKGWGYHVLIYHPKHKIYTHYAHLQGICVKESEQVKEGQLVGPLGSTGGNWPPHLHFEIRLTDRPANVYVNGMSIEEIKQNYANPEIQIKGKTEEEKNQKNSLAPEPRNNIMLKLIKNQSSNKVYAVDKDDKKHWIFNQETLAIGKEMGLWDDSDIETVQDDPYEEGHTLLLVRH